MTDEQREALEWAIRVAEHEASTTTGEGRLFIIADANGRAKSLRSLLSSTDEVARLREQVRVLKDELRRIIAHEEGPGYYNDFGDGYEGCDECKSMKDIASAALDK